VSDNGSFLFGRYLRGSLPVLAVVTVMTLFTCGTAHAADDDDDDDDSWADKSSSSTSGGDVEMWPPTSIGWPPLVPGDQAVAGPIVPVGPPPGEEPTTAPGESVPPRPIVSVQN
jgi:hypothetical protein